VPGLSLAEAIKFRSFLPKVHGKDGQTTLEGHGLGVFQLAWTWRPGIPQKGGDDEWGAVQAAAGGQVEFFMTQNGTSHFLQDGAPCHTSKIVKE
jgi:hypothetical protein